MEPITSMGDASGDGWYNIVFSSWTTFKVNDNGEDELTYELPYKNDKNRDRLVEDVAVPMNEGKTPYKALHENSQTYKDFEWLVIDDGSKDNK